MKIETEQLVLRPLTLDDADDYAAMAADPDVMRFFPHPLTRKEADLRLAEVIARARNDGFGFLAATERATDAFLGMIGIGRIPLDTRTAIPRSPEIEIGWTLARRAWGQGLAPEGARACLTYGFETLGFEEIVAFTAATNIPSQRVMEKIGMRRAPADDFDHPGVEIGHRLRRHVLYRIANAPS